MTVLLEQYWWVLVIALLIGVAVAWAIFGRTQKTRVETTISPDVLDEGAAPARRNQALIDAPPATQAAAPPTPSAAPVQTTEPQPAPPPPVPAVPCPKQPRRSWPRRKLRHRLALEMISPVSRG